MMIVFTGKASELIDRGDNTYGGKYVVNPSGGLISKGHPLGATGQLSCRAITSCVMYDVITSCVMYDVITSV